ncbi:hypothetical protein K4F52_002298 [Lecanicillium sp. MT-2017a]|nr:hypothetical protein K4F52_002298 [Lecanicillium sp. MT-2017a]
MPMSPVTTLSPPFDDVPDKFVDVTVADVEFLATLNEGNDSVLFKVAVQGNTCVMKVFHGRKTYFNKPGGEEDLFVREWTAYRLLKRHGLCKRGVVPDFYGTIRGINPREWPNLHMFHKDTLPADAVLIEYIPNMHMIDLSNYTEERAARLSKILLEINSIGILHCDIYPRNMMVVEGEAGTGQERVLWVDFDCAQVIPPEFSPEHAHYLFDLEKRLMECFAQGMAKDHMEGKLNAVKDFYYSYS